MRRISVFAALRTPGVEEVYVRVDDRGAQWFTEGRRRSARGRDDGPLVESLASNNLCQPSDWRFQIGRAVSVNA